MPVPFHLERYLDCFQIWQLWEICHENTCTASVLMRFWIIWIIWQSMVSFYTNWAAQWICGWRRLLPNVTIWVWALELTWWKERTKSCKMSSDSHTYSVVCGLLIAHNHIQPKINTKSKKIMVIFQVCVLHFHRQCKHFDVQYSCLL